MGDVVLFDGGSVEGWRMAGEGGFDLVDGTLVSRGGMGLLWYAAREFGDVEVSLAWRVARPVDNSGVFVRFPDPGGDPWVAVEHGCEVQVQDVADDPTRRTGAIYRRAAPGVEASRPVGEWNRFVIRVVGDELVVVLNGVEVNRWRGVPRRRGFVGIQNHDDASRVAFRDIHAGAPVG